LTPARTYDTVIQMEEVLTIRLPKGTRRRLARRAKAQHLSVSQLVRRALEQEELLTGLAMARAELLPQARAQGIYTDEDVFAIVS
jgi:predicted transcriptional regulator